MIALFRRIRDRLLFELVAFDYDPQYSRLDRLDGRR